MHTYIDVTAGRIPYMSSLEHIVSVFVSRYPLPTLRHAVWTLLIPHKQHYETIYLLEHRTSCTVVSSLFPYYQFL
jgi:hypothetical protein